MIKKQKHGNHPQTPQRAAADGADVVNFNDGEAGPGEACLCSILSRAFLCSQHTNETAMQGMEEATWHIQVTVVSSKSAAAVVLPGLESDYAKGNELLKAKSHFEEKQMATSDYFLPMYC